MRMRRFWSAAVAMVMVMLVCLPMAYASDDGTQVVSAPLTYALNARSGMVRVYLSSMGSPTSWTSRCPAAIRSAAARP